MAYTEWTADDALKNQWWSAAVFKFGQQRSVFARMFSDVLNVMQNARGVDISSSEDALCQIKTEFGKQKGTKCTWALVNDLEGEGRNNDDDVRGEEERLETYDFSAELFGTANAVISKGKLSEMRVKLDFVQTAIRALGAWHGKKIDKLSLAALSGLASADGLISAVAPSTNRKWVGGQTSAGVISHATDNLDANLTATATSGLFGTAVISTVKRKAVATEPIIRPIIADGEEIYVMLIDPLQAKALKAETAWLEAQRHANIRGLKNPIFSGALGMYDGVVIHEWPRIAKRLGAGGETADEYFDSGDPLANTVRAARALFCGAQALVHGYGQMPDTVVDDTIDYRRRTGVMTDSILTVAKPKFNDEDYGVMVVDTTVVAD